jgi:hypothetical protein
MSSKLLFCGRASQELPLRTIDNNELALTIGFA